MSENHSEKGLAGDQGWRLHFASLIRNFSGLRNRIGLMLEFDFDGVRLQFSRPHDFEFCLAGRTALPRARVAGLVHLPANALVREAAAIKRIEQRLVDALEASLQGRRSLHDALHELGTDVYAPEQGWRGLFEGLSRVGRELDLFRRIAIAKYLQFLGAQQELIRSLLSDPGRSDVTLPPPRLEDTMMLQLGASADPLGRPAGMAQLPRGEPVELRLPHGESVEIRLADRPFTLIAGTPMTLIDDRGKVYALPSGMCGVGRDLRNVVAVDSGYRSVSRRHVVLETLGPDRLRMTDLSSHGTYVPRACLKIARH